ncbi:MAG: DUF1553 domain-containing protein [Bryobacteraceae bacterium]
MLRYLISFALAAVPASAVEFNRDVRPILSDRCFTCHGPDNNNRKANLRLDVEAAAKARDIIVAGQPDKSKLYQRIVSTNRALRMPPAYAGHAALTKSQVDSIRQWIEAGAPWQGHWSFVAPRKGDLPEVSNAAWPANPIDNYILSRLDKQGLRPSSQAGPSTLLRRLSLDLTGLPPTPAEMEAFLRDTAPNAYEKQVDRLLASDQHAERMAIRWLDAARYADTNGYQSDGVRDMWRWRDWVIDAFRSNMPFDRFTIEQIAGDLLPNPSLSQKVATGFHRNHRTSAEGGIIDEEFRTEYVADRAETTSTVWLGLTMGCSRCHDHKYDPMTQRDFYSLFAFFNNLPEKGFVYNFGNEPPFVTAPTAPQQAKLDGLDARATAARRKWESLESAVGRERSKWEKSIRKQADLDWRPGDGMVLHQLSEETATFNGGPGRDLGAGVGQFNHRDRLTLAAWVNPATEKGTILSRAEDYWEGTGYGIHLVNGKLRFHFIFRWTDLGLRVETKDKLPLNRWSHIAVTYDGGMKASGVHIYVDGVEKPLDVLFDQHLWPIKHKAPFLIGAGSGQTFEGSVREVLVYDRDLTPREVSTLPLEETLGEIAAIDSRRRTPQQQAKLELAFVDRYLPAQLEAALAEARNTQAERDRYFATLPTVMVMEEGPVRQAHILKRGAYDQPGDAVSAAVPAFLPPLPPGAPANRLGLARWLVARENPLTARVTVNRFWQMLFGTGLVKTTEDFGSQGEWPIHQDLLDWLAVEFMDSGWNIRHTIKTIVMSATYRQSSAVTPELLRDDPENRLYARAPRYRLPAEAIRDQALAVAGLLQQEVGGPPVKPYQPPNLWRELSFSGGEYEADHGAGLYRRSLYTYWRRTIAPPAMVAFDSPTRESCTVRENRTNTPLQALNLMNDVTYVEASRKFAERILAGHGDDAGRIGFAFLAALGREPRNGEAKAITSFLAKMRARFAADTAAAHDLLAQGESRQAAEFASEAELAAWTSVASLILNLDETVTRE